MNVKKHDHFEPHLCTIMTNTTLIFVNVNKKCYLTLRHSQKLFTILIGPIAILIHWQNILCDHEARRRNPPAIAIVNDKQLAKTKNMKGLLGFIQNFVNLNKICFKTRNDLPNLMELANYQTNVILTKYWSKSTPCS